MAAFLYLATPDSLDKTVEGMPTILLDDEPEYWFLYRYFEAANLDRNRELIDLYDGHVIDGYQLHRLKTELQVALADIETKADVWHVLVGWAGGGKSIETERWQAVEKATMRNVIQSLLQIIEICEASGLKLVSSGD